MDQKKETHQNLISMSHARITGSGWKFVDSRYQARLFNKSATSCRARFT